MLAAPGQPMKSLPARLFSSAAICRRRQSSKVSTRASYASRAHISHDTDATRNFLKRLTHGSKKTGQESRKIRRQGGEEDHQEEQCEGAGQKSACACTQTKSTYAEGEERKELPQCKGDETFEKRGSPEDLSL